MVKEPDSDYFSDLHLVVESASILYLLQTCQLPILFQWVSFYEIQVVQPCNHIPNIILFSTSFGLEIVLSHIFGVSLFHSYLVTVNSLSTSGTIHRANNAPSKSCFDCLRSIILTGNKINGFQYLRTNYPYQESSRYVIIFNDLVQHSFKMSPLV